MYFLTLIPNHTHDVGKKNASLESYGQKTVLVTCQASKTRIRLFRARVRFGVKVGVKVVVIMVRTRVGIRVYLKPFHSAAKP